jgi:SGF29 tudor-like domain
VRSDPAMSILLTLTAGGGPAKKRYKVQDVQAAEGKEGEPGLEYNTTLKAIIPMPDPRDRSTYPEHDLVPGTEVLALFPETTSFYRGRTVGLPTNKVTNFFAIFVSRLVSSP